MAGNAGKGRKVGSRNKRTLAALELVGNDGKTPCAFALEIMRDEEQDLEVRLEAARIAAPYLHPRPQPQGRFVSFEVPLDINSAAAVTQILGNVLRAVAAGSMAIEEGKDIAAILETHRRTVETTVLEERIARLEKNLGSQNK